MPRTTKPTVKDLIKTIDQLVDHINLLENSIRVLDTGVFLAIHSLKKENKIYQPDVHSADDIRALGVFDEIKALSDILEEAAKNDEAKQAK